MAVGSPKKKRGCFGCLGYAALGLIGLFVLAVLAGRPPVNPVSPPGSPPAQAVPSVPVGSEGVLAGPDSGGNGTWLAKTEPDFGPMIEAHAEIPRAKAEGRAGGGAAQQRLTDAGRIRIYANGTRVRVKDVGPGSLFVELLDGEDKGRSGRVQAECVRLSR